ncbi:MAG: outer membrane beta-barrel protein [Candidatus Coatesbacteria bacterium]|nr:MAG: outer membrane beta-barrel protein [Candidatus Coatesbacteria bacterium]
MGRITLFTVAGLFAATAASAVGFGFGGCYLLGMPIGEAKVTEYTANYGSYRVTVDVDTRNGLPLKMGTINFGVGAVVNFVPLFGIEGGFEMHTKYNNKAATVSGIVSYGGYEEPFYEQVLEDQVKWKMNNIYAGARFNLPFGGSVKPYADGGFLLIFGKGVALDNGAETNDYVKGTNMGVYFGFGTNVFVSKMFAISIPVKFNMPFAGTYKGYGSGYEGPGEGKLKPPAYFTFGVGTEIFVL